MFCYALLIELSEVAARIHERLYLEPHLAHIGKPRLDIEGSPSRLA